MVYDPEAQTEAMFRRAAAQRVVEAADQGAGWLSTAVHAELRMAWQRGVQAGEARKR